MHLVQILLPIKDNDGHPFPPAMFTAVRGELASRFGGLTAFTQSPAEGLWVQEGEGVTRDQIVIFEVMAEELDPQWWRAYRAELEREFRQEHVVVRSQQIELL